MSPVRAAAALLSAALVALALMRIAAQEDGLATREIRVGDTPATLRFVPGAPPAPAVVIAHGFAGSRQLMAPFAATLARAGYVTLAYDALGHGRAGAALPAGGATAALVAEIAAVAAAVRALPESDGRLALLGHSMASDVVVRAALADPDVAATVAVSLFSPAVGPERPGNLLVVTGAWEPGLRAEALRVAGLAAGAPAAPFVTTGDPAAGTARRAAIAPRVEHVGVLYAPVALAEARDWLHLVFGRDGAAAPDARGGWLGLWLLGTLGLAWGLAPLLPRLAPARPRAPPRRARFAAAVLVPASLAPLLATRLPGGLLPAPVADYLAAHFLVFGLVCGAILLASRRPAAAVAAGGRAIPVGRLAAAATALTLFGLVALFAPIDAFVASLALTPPRLPLFAALAVATLPYFLADETLVRAPDAPRGGYALAKAAFLASLALAIALAPGRLFFLILILPVTLIFFALFGLIGAWAFRATGSPLPAALANAVLMAWAVAATFPILG